MAFGFPPHQKERRNLVLSMEDAKKKAIATFEKLHYHEIGLHPFALDYSSPSSVLTAGERFYVNITEDEIIVRSECIFITRFFDFGKNQANIKEFWEVYDSIIL
jgi:hypothetical protein